MDRKLKWGVLGCAGIAGRCVIPGILMAENAELYAISSRGISGKLIDFQQRFHPVKTCDSYESMLDDPEVEAVYVPLPNGLHAEWAIRAMEKKKHVLCEKPMGTTVTETGWMLDKARETGMLLMEAFAYLHSPITRRVKDLVDCGAIGNVHFYDGHFTFNNMAADNVRYNSSLAGGATYDIGCYPISQIRWLLGSEPIGIKATGIVGNSGVDISSCSILTFPGDITAVCYCGFEDFPRVEYSVVGETGMIRVPFSFNYEGDAYIILETQDGTQTLPVNCPHNYMLEIEQFGRAVMDGEPPLVTPEFTLGNAVVIEEILRQIM